VVAMIVGLGMWTRNGLTCGARSMGQSDLGSPRVSRGAFACQPGEHGTAIVHSGG
jgi:hypothetical protein